MAADAAATAAHAPIDGMWGPIPFAEPRAAKDGFPAWHPPTAGVNKGLKVNNSLIPGEPVIFIPGHGNRVLWYTCGPTVYDSCHMGHARAYLTFDILRRIMEDYFGYDVLYHVNITDIDDKIILRARRNKLLSEYLAKLQADSATAFDTLKQKVSAALEARKSKLTKKTEELETPLPADAPGRLRDERETKIKEHKLKVSQFEATAGKANAIVQAADKSAVEALMDVARDELGEMLDKELGSSVTDQQVFDAHARKFENEYLEDMASLGVREPDVLTRVTEYVPQIVEFVQKIIEKGLAYESGGSVYLSIDAFKQAGHDYRKLVPEKGVTSADAMAESEGALGGGGEKRHPNDFALWKASKPGEPHWDSPWGQGRPGWHIECSVIASDILGQNMDIHAGGIDLNFPHNDNELAQAEAHFDHHQWVNYFLHAGHLDIKGLKMSKSLKNFITIRQALKSNTARELRLMFLLQPWDKRMNYSDQTMKEAQAKEKQFRNFFDSVKAALRNPWLKSKIGWVKTDRQLYVMLADTQTAVHDALCDNFNTLNAITAMCQLVSDANKFLSCPEPPSPLLLKKIAIYLSKILRVFGVIEGNDSIGFGATAAGGDPETMARPYLDSLVDFRTEVRTAVRVKGGSDPRVQAVLSACDRVRDETLPTVGVQLDDLPDGSTRWKLADPERLKAEMEQKKQQEEAKRRKKIENKLKDLRLALENASKYAAPPAEFFSDPEKKYADFGDDGVPSTADGEELSKKARKKLAKDLKTHTTKHEKLIQDSAGDVAQYKETLKQQIAAQEAELRGEAAPAAAALSTTAPAVASVAAAAAHSTVV
eukprot:m.486900 g.486900  ORF g.486900 m.486900 type:complete len:825 (-) comp24665_c0_seq1:170-2644(-)